MWNYLHSFYRCVSLEYKFMLVWFKHIYIYSIWSLCDCMFHIYFDLLRDCHPPLSNFSSSPRVHANSVTLFPMYQIIQFRQCFIYCGWTVCTKLCCGSLRELWLSLFICHLYCCYDLTRIVIIIINFACIPAYIYIFHCIPVCIYDNVYIDICIFIWINQMHSYSSALSVWGKPTTRTTPVIVRIFNWERLGARFWHLRCCD